MENLRKRPKRSLRALLKEVKRGTDALTEHVESGGDVNLMCKGTTLLCEASRHGNSDGVQYLLDHGANPDLCDMTLCSPIYLAASHGRLTILQMLVEAGADLNKRNQNGFTALVSAIQNGHDDCALQLIDAGAEVNISRPNTLGVDLPLLSYILFAKGDTKMAEKVLKAGTMPYKFMEPLGFILLEDSQLPLSYVQHLIAAGFEVYCDGWVEMMKRRGDKEISPVQKDLLDMLEYEHKNAPSLQRLSRVAVRTSLILHATRTHMRKKIEALPLPVELKKYVALDYL